MKPLDDRAQKGIRAFAYAFGLIADADLAKKGVTIPFHMIEGRQAVVKIQRENDWTDGKGQTQKGGLKVRFNNDTWPVSHDAVKDVHKNREALALLALFAAGLALALGYALDGIWMGALACLALAGLWLAAERRGWPAAGASTWSATRSAMPSAEAMASSSAR